MSDLANALTGLSPMTREEIARQVKTTARSEAARMTDELAYWAQFLPAPNLGRRAWK